MKATTASIVKFQMDLIFRIVKRKQGVNGKCKSPLLFPFWGQVQQGR